MKSSKRWVFSQLEKYIWTSVINETLLKWKSVPSRIDPVVSWVQEPIVPITTTKNMSLGKLQLCWRVELETRLEKWLEKMLFTVERKEKVLTVPTVEKLATEWRVKYLILKKIIEKLWGVQSTFKSSLMQCCEKEKRTTENFLNDCNLEDWCIHSTFLSISKLWALLSKKDMKERRESWAKWPEPEKLKRWGLFMA